VDHPGDETLVVTNVGADHADQVNNDERIDEVLQHAMEFLGRLMKLLQLLDIVKRENKTGEALEGEDGVEKEVAGLDIDIVPALDHLDRDHRPEIIGLLQSIGQPLGSRLPDLDEPAADQQDTKSVADQAVDVPKPVVEFVGDSPCLVGGDGYPFFLELLLDKRDGIARTEDGGGQQDDGDGGSHEKDKSPVPDANGLGMGFKERMLVHMGQYGGLDMKVRNNI
jgi:hypothetical protein